MLTLAGWRQAQPAPELAALGRGQAAQQAAAGGWGGELNAQQGFQAGWLGVRQLGQQPGQRRGVPVGVAAQMGADCRAVVLGRALPFHAIGQRQVFQGVEQAAVLAGAGLPILQGVGQPLQQFGVVHLVMPGDAAQGGGDKTAPVEF